MDWYAINNINKIDTPALIVYKQRVLENIRKAVAAIGNADLLRPHVKTNKIAEVSSMMMREGINKFKCATIAEAEMLAMIDARDILLAYQPVGPRAERFLQLNLKYPSVRFSCIADDAVIVRHLSEIFSAAGKTLNIFIDLNTGMNRTGVEGKDVFAFINEITQLPVVHVRGLHAYDGHIRDQDIRLRQQHSDEAFSKVAEVLQYIESKLGRRITVVSGGSPTFATHIGRNVECSPGTFVFWDWGYYKQFPDEPFKFAALVITRVISIINSEMVTTDLGHKAVAAENPLPRVHFLNAPDAIPVAQSEEHLSVRVPDSSKYNVGDVLYGVPVHVCPTVALYDEVLVVQDNNVVDTWKVTARGRKINI